MTTQAEFIEQHAIGGNLTPEQAAQLLELAGQGDTGTPLPELGGEPGVTPAQEEQAAAELGAEDPELNDSNAVVMAKDGKHTINFSVLANEREEKQHWKEDSSAKDAVIQQKDADILVKDQEIQQLRQQLQANNGGDRTAEQNAAIAQQAIEAGVDPDLFGDLSEEDLAKGVTKLAESVFEKMFATRIAPYQEQQRQEQEQQARDAHVNTILTAHPDAESIAQSRELAEWIAAQPSFVRAGYETVLDRGTTAQVVELFDSFKQATGRTPSTQPAAADAKAAAKAAVAGIKTPAPASLSDIPGGTAGPSNRFETLASLAPADMSAAMAGMNAEQIEAFLNRNG